MLVVPTPPFASFHGTLGNVTFQQTRGQQWLRHRPTIPNPRTSAQQATRAAMASCYHLWNTHYLWAKTAWENEALLSRISGWNAFCKANRTPEQLDKVLTPVPVKLSVPPPLDLIYTTLAPGSKQIRGDWTDNSPAFFTHAITFFRKVNTDSFFWSWTVDAHQGFVIRVMPESAVMYDCYTCFCVSGFGFLGSPGGQLNVLSG